MPDPHRLQIKHLALRLASGANNAGRPGKVSHESGKRCLEHEQPTAAFDLDTNVAAFPLERNGLPNKPHFLHATHSTDSGPSTLITGLTAIRVNGAASIRFGSRSSVHPCAGEERVAPGSLHPSNDLWHPLGAA